MMDIVNMNLEAGQIVEVTTAPSTPPKKLSVPILGLEKFPTQQEIEGQDVRNRRPVRPIDRQRMRPWLMELLDLGNVFGLRWTNREQGIFQISWRHASRLGWNLETDGDVFERWARHTGIYKEGDPPEPKRWKANFRCALHSLHDVMELTSALERRGRNACRTYQFLQNNNAGNPKTKSKEKRQKPIEPKESRELVHVLTYERPIRQQVQIQLPESGGSSDELLSSETESESSHQNKVIVQRVDPKSGEIGEEEFLLHDHDYSGQQDKTQRTIYLRQGVGSIVLHKEVLNAPQLLEDAKAAEALSNLEQLASAAVGTQEIEGGTIMIDANVLSGGSNMGSPTKSSLSEDESAISLKKLLPRLRARIKESERAGGILRKRKYLAEDMEMLGEKRILGHNQYRLKKAKSDVGTSPTSPVGGGSGSPQKQTKSGSKSKRARKESEGSASDSTEPLMSSCLLLLEAATRLDKAEKGEGLPDKKLKHGKRGVDRSGVAPVSSKKKRGMRSIKFEEQEVIEEPVLEGIGETAIEGGEESVIEERIVYQNDGLQVVYEDAIVANAEVTVNSETQDVEEQVAFDFLRSALENIGSEMEVSTTSNDVSSPKEMAIMRRKKDSDKPSLGFNTLTGGQIVVSESSFAKGLFSGSEIIPSISQSGLATRKASKIKSKPSSKDNIYYVDIRADGGSISVKQSDDTSVSAGNNITSTTTSPQIFIATRQNSLGQQIVVPVKNQKLKPSTTTTAINSPSIQQLTADATNVVGGKSFISLGPKGKPIILKKPSSTTASLSTSPSPVVTQMGPQSLPSNVKISTLPIISTLKPMVSIPAPTTNAQKNLLTSSPMTTISSPAVSPRSGQLQQIVTLVSSQVEADDQASRTFYIQVPSSASDELDAKHQPSSPVKCHIVTPGQTDTSPTGDVLKEGDFSDGTINAQVIMDPVKGPCIQLPNSTTTIPLTQDLVLSTSPTSGTTTQTLMVHPSSGEITQQQYNVGTVSSATSDFNQVGLYSVTDGEQNLEREVKTEPVENEQGLSSVTVVQDKTKEVELVYTVKGEDGRAYYIPIQGEHDRSSCGSPAEEGDNDGNIRVEVKTENGDQTCFISPEQLEQANHIIHISQETEESAVVGSSETPTETDVSEINEGEGGIPEQEDSASTVVGEEDEQYSISVPCSSSMNIDPRAPLVIQEIPLFASSKGESEEQQST